LKFDAGGWDAYVEANRMFCQAVAERFQPGDLVWVHDYHLLLLPQMLRAELPDAAIGFFLHIPFPSAEIFPILPRREDQQFRASLRSGSIAQNACFWTTAGLGSTTAPMRSCGLVQPLGADLLL
jgi:hypothetical protein